MSWTMCCSLQIGLHLRRSTSLERFTYLDYPSLTLLVSRAYAHYISLLYHRTTLRYEYLGIYKHLMYVDRQGILTVALRLYCSLRHSVSYRLSSFISFPQLVLNRYLTQ